ncbi:hypothetical protein [Streptomyces neyagawaensis]|uniref:hypothetical protein n=1 Tax=Streptomyces neyagawaensis TaxID=42238 RepID=UPI0027E48AAC|nr:hypothetical protein [Streptomyces neyagawaensis]
MRTWDGLVDDVDSTPDVRWAPHVGAGLAEVRVVAADPATAQRVARVLRRVFHCDEPRSYPTGPDGRSTLLHLTVDTHLAIGSPHAAGPWLYSSRSQGERTHPDEPCCTHAAPPVPGA